MADNLRTELPPTNVSSLVGGIIDDAQRLIRQELTLAKREIQDEIGKAKTAAVSLAAGLFIGLFGAVLLCFMLVYLINWVSNDHVPLWACYGIVGGVLAVLGAILVYSAKNKASDINVVPPQTAATMRENVQWLKNQT